MTRFESRQQVSGGTYFNTTSWSLHAVDGVSGELPGAAGTRWVRLALPVVVLVALVSSLVFLVFLPFIGLALAAWTLLGMVGRGVQYAAARLAHVVAPQWQPGEAWLARIEARKAEHPTPAPLSALQQDVADQKAREEDAHGKR